MTAKKNLEAIGECVRFCKFCEEKWKRGEYKEFDVEVAIAACSICGTPICKDHSFIRRGERRCRDRKECRVIVPEQDEGGGD